MSSKPSTTTTLSAARYSRTYEALAALQRHEITLTEALLEISPTPENLGAVLREKCGSIREVFNAFRQIENHPLPVCERCGVKPAYNCAYLACPYRKVRS